MKILLLIIVLALAACNSEEESEVIRIAYLPITHSAVLMIMDGLEIEDSPYELELIRFTTWPDVVDALLTGRVHGASILFEVALRAREIDDSLVMLSLSHRDGNVVVVDHSIETYHDLIGKTIAIPHRLSPQYTLLQMVFEREGIPPGAVKIIELSPAEMMFTLASGAISAYIVAEPFGAVAENAGVGRIFETSNEIMPGKVCCVIVFRSCLLDDDLLEWFMTNFEYAAEMANSQEGAAAEAFSRHTRQSDDVIEESLRNTTFCCLHLSPEEFDEITETILRFGALNSVPSFDEFTNLP